MCRCRFQNTAASVIASSDFKLGSDARALDRQLFEANLIKLVIRYCWGFDLLQKLVRIEDYAGLFILALLLGLYLVEALDDIIGKRIPFNNLPRFALQRNNAGPVLVAVSLIYLLVPIVTLIL